MQGKGLKWLVVLILGVAILVPIGVLWAYSNNLGPISQTPSDWGDFGAVLGGAFTLIGALATTATLLFLFHQQQQAEARQQDHDELVRRQLQAVTFEQYLKHRELFIQRLDEISASAGKEFTFHNPEKLYRAVFPENSPTHCETSRPLAAIEKIKAGDPSDCVQIHERLGESINFTHDEDTILEILRRITTLHHYFGMVFPNPTVDGDVHFLDKSSGINIYNLSETIAKIEATLNFILFYSGNNQVSSICHKLQGPGLRDDIYKILTNSKRAQAGYKIIFITPELKYLHTLLDLSQDRTLGKKRLLNKSYIAIATLLSETPNDPQKIQETISVIDTELDEVIAGLGINTEWPQIIIHANTALAHLKPVN